MLYYEEEKRMKCFTDKNSGGLENIERKEIIKVKKVKIRRNRLSTEKTIFLPKKKTEKTILQRKKRE